jgi:SAM-dependent methyltransferase
VLVFGISAGRNVENLQELEIRSKVREAYTAAADRPGEKHPFPIGRAFAESLGYPATLLDTLPSQSVDAFAGVSNVSLFAEISEGTTVLDLGCGAGLDSLIAARRTGPSGKVIGIDFSAVMLERARQSAKAANIENAQFEQADAEQLPVAAASVDVALVNGIFNLNPAREAIFKELARVLKIGGKLFGAELILGRTLPPNVNQTAADWFA